MRCSVKPALHAPPAAGALQQLLGAAAAVALPPLLLAAAAAASNTGNVCVGCQGVLCRCWGSAALHWQSGHVHWHSLSRPAAGLRGSRSTTCGQPLPLLGAMLHWHEGRSGGRLMAVPRLSVWPPPATPTTRHSPRPRSVVWQASCPVPQPHHARMDAESSSKVEQLRSVCGMDEQSAEAFLGMAEGSVERAVELFFETAGNPSAGAGAGGSGGGAGDAMEEEDARLAAQLYEQDMQEQWGPPAAAGPGAAAGAGPMAFCQVCGCDVEVEVDDAQGFACCVNCGRVLEERFPAAGHEGEPGARTGREAHGAHVRMGRRDQSRGAALTGAHPCRWPQIPSQGPCAATPLPGHRLASHRARRWGRAPACVQRRATCTRLGPLGGLHAR